MSKIRNLFKVKAKGGLTFLEICVIAAIVLLVGYPLFKAIINSIFTTIQTWFNTTLPTIFS